MKPGLTHFVSYTEFWRWLVSGIGWEPGNYCLRFSFYFGSCTAEVTVYILEKQAHSPHTKNKHVLVTPLLAFILLIMVLFLQNVVDLEHVVILFLLHDEGRMLYGIFVAQVANNETRCSELYFPDLLCLMPSRPASCFTSSSFGAQFFIVRRRASRLLASLANFLHLYLIQRYPAVA